MLCLWSKSRHTSPLTSGLQGLCPVFGGSIGFQPRKSIASREGLFIQNPIPCFPLDFVLPQPVSRPFLLTLPGPTVYLYSSQHYKDSDIAVSSGLHLTGVFSGVLQQTQNQKYKQTTSTLLGLEL